MVADPRWLEIIKASSGQAFAMAGAAGALLLTAYWKWVPPLDPWVIHAATVILVLGTLLWLVSVVSALIKFFAPKTWILHWIRIRREKRAAEEYIPFMTEREKKIVAYLLHHNQKSFTCASDGGYATTLISRGILLRALISGQVFDAEDMPIVVPDHIWNVLAKHKDKFSYEEDEDGAHPWRVHWMVR